MGTDGLPEIPEIVPPVAEVAEAKAEIAPATAAPAKGRKRAVGKKLEGDSFPKWIPVCYRKPGKPYTDVKVTIDRPTGIITLHCTDVDGVSTHRFRANSIEG